MEHDDARQVCLTEVLNGIQTNDYTLLTRAGVLTEVVGVLCEHYASDTPITVVEAIFKAGVGTRIANYVRTQDILDLSPMDVTELAHTIEATVENMRRLYPRCLPEFNACANCSKPRLKSVS